MRVGAKGGARLNEYCKLNCPGKNSRAQFTRADASFASRALKVIGSVLIEAIAATGRHAAVPEEAVIEGAAARLAV